MSIKRFWDGKSVHIVIDATQHDRRSVEIGLTPEAAGEVANCLRSLTALGQPSLPDRVQELLQALDYVLVADPASVAAHRQMQAGKGMEPASGDARSYAHPPREGRASLFTPRPFRNTEEKRGDND